MILIREWVRLWVSGFFFKAVVQSVLLFGAETCGLPPPRARDGSWGVFQYQV